MGKIIFDQTIRRKARTRSKIEGSAKRPRISIFRSNRYIYGQAVDDGKRVTIVAYSSTQLGKDKKNKKKEEAHQVGLGLGRALISKKIKNAVFDRGSYAYKGRVKELCDGIREAGVQI